MWPRSRTVAPLASSSAHGQPLGTTRQTRNSARGEGEGNVGSVFEGNGSLAYGSGEVCGGLWFAVSERQMSNSCGKGVAS